MTTASPTPPEHHADSAYCSDAQVGLPSEEEIARALAEAMRQKSIPDHIWQGQVASFRDLEAKFPDYATGYSVSTDAFRQARAILDLIRPAFEAACNANSDGWRKLAMDEHQKRLSAESKLAQAVEALNDVLAANQRFRDQMPANWEGDPLQDACDRAAPAMGEKAALASSQEAT